MYGADADIDGTYQEPTKTKSRLEEPIGYEGCADEGDHQDQDGVSALRLIESYVRVSSGDCNAESSGSPHPR